MPKSVPDRIQSEMSGSQGRGFRGWGELLYERKGDLKRLWPEGPPDILYVCMFVCMCVCACMHVNLCANVCISICASGGVIEI